MKAGSLAGWRREAFLFSQKKGDPGATLLLENLSSSPGSPHSPLTVLFPTESIVTATRPPLSKVLPTHLSVTHL